MKKIYIICLTLISLSGFAQNLGNAKIVERPADYEYLSDPDSTGTRHLIKTISSGYNKMASYQMKLPYPILFIHGLNSNSETWTSFTNSLDFSFGFKYGGRMDFCLNYDNNNYTASMNADIALFNPTLQVGDYYCVNFDVSIAGGFNPFYLNPNNVLSNQQAIAKQGVAVREAINRILQITGREKVIILGHSMGGLAAREYLQNPINWQPDGKHHVAKLVTTGTPHKGSNASAKAFSLLAGADELSEAERDLKRTYALSGQKSVYLEGGYESNSIMNPQYGYYYNVDVNCNGIPGDSIMGLNTKKPITDIDYSCIIGICTSGCIDPNRGDGIVLDYSANLNTCYPNLKTSVFNYYGTAFTEIHTDLPKQSLQNMEGLDEPNSFSLAYGIDFNNTYTGFITPQADNDYLSPDDDLYKFNVPSKSNVKLRIDSIYIPDLIVAILDTNKQIINSFHSNGKNSIDISQILDAGNYFIIIEGLPSSNNWLHPYKFLVTATPCGIVSTPVISANGSLSFCKGSSINLTSSYSTGIIWSDTISNVIRFAVNMQPAIDLGIFNPSIDFIDVAGSFNGWGSNNIKLTRSGTSSIYTFHIDTLTEGRTIQFVFRINSNWSTSEFSYAQAKRTYIVKHMYLYRTSYNSEFYLLSKEIYDNYAINTSSISVSTTGNYFVTYTDGNNCSTSSKITKVTVNPLPVAPSISLNGNILTSNISTGNQWYRNAAVIPNATSQNMVPVSTGNYTVKYTDSNGCSTMSGPFYYQYTGIEEVALNNTLILFPNPVIDKLDVKFNGQIEKIIVSSVLGEAVKIVKNITGDKIQIDLSELNNGIYFVSFIEKDGGNIIRKIIKN